MSLIQWNLSMQSKNNAPTHSRGSIWGASIAIKRGTPFCSTFSIHFGSFGGSLANYGNAKEVGLWGQTNLLFCLILVWIELIWFIFNKSVTLLHPRAFVWYRLGIPEKRFVRWTPAFFFPSDKSDNIWHMKTPEEKAAYQRWEVPFRGWHKRLYSKLITTTPGSIASTLPIGTARGQIVGCSNVTEFPSARNMRQSRNDSGIPEAPRTESV